MNGSTKVDRRLSANGYLRFGGTRIGTGLVRRGNDGDAAKPRAKLWYAGVAQPLAKLWVIEPQWVSLRHDGAPDFDATLWARWPAPAAARRWTSARRCGRSPGCAPTTCATASAR